MNGSNGLGDRDWECYVENTDIADEVKVVAVTNASTKPYAVMVEPSHAIVASVTVDGPWCSKDLTGFAEFQ